MVRRALETAGIPHLLLKGRGLAALLYRDQEPRTYNDCDLLIPPDERDRAHAVLTGLGFSPRPGFGQHDLARNSAAAQALHSIDWVREADGMAIDLHYTIAEMSAAPATVWDVMSRRTVTLDVGGFPAPVPDPPAAALLCALHVAQHGPLSHRPLEDLTRAIDQLDAHCWEDAAQLAVTLGATATLGTGLRLAPGGTVLADRLGLPWEPSRRMTLQWERAPWGATVWDSLLHTHGLRARAALLAGVLIPPPESLRLGSALARRGAAGLIAAYVVREVRIASRVLPALRAWRRHVRAERCEAARSGDLMHDEPGRGFVAMQRDADERLDRR